MKKIFLKNNKLTVILRSEASSGSYQPLDITQNWSDSEYTQSLQTRNNGRFRMTEKFPLSLGEGWGEGWHWQKALKTAALTLALSLFIAAVQLYQTLTRRRSTQSLLIP